jgi:hypothetical protein
VVAVGAPRRRGPNGSRRPRRRSNDLRSRARPRLHDGRTRSDDGRTACRRPRRRRPEAGWAVRGRGPADPVRASPVPGAAAVVAVPVRPDLERHDGEPDDRTTRDDQDASVLIRVLEISGPDPASIETEGNVAPRPVIHTAVDLHRCARRDPRYPGIVAPRACAHVRRLGGVSGLRRRGG